MIEAEILFFTCYGAMTFWALMSCLYLLLRRNNVFATDAGQQESVELYDGH